MGDRSSGHEIESQIAKRLTECGFDVKRNAKIGSLSPDILAKDDRGNHIIIEVKGTTVGSLDVARVNAMLHDFHAKAKKVNALILTNRSATTDAMKLAGRIGVEIISDPSLDRLSERFLNSLDVRTK